MGFLLLLIVCILLEKKNRTTSSLLLDYSSDFFFLFSKPINNLSMFLNQNLIYLSFLYTIAKFYLFLWRWISKLTAVLLCSYWKEPFYKEVKDLSFLFFSLYRWSNCFSFSWTKWLTVTIPSFLPHDVHDTDTVHLL